MGGIRTDARGHARGLKGLFACGEAACWDLHGFNRLGGNSVAETVVAGMIVGENMADFVESAAGELQVSTALVRECLESEQAKLDTLLHGNGTESGAELMRRMQDIMTDKVGIFRTGELLQAAVEELQGLLVRSRRIGLRTRRPGANPELVTAYRVQKMLKLALCVAYGALQRTESRGAHFREDYPRRDDASWLKRTLATWHDDFQTLPTLDYEALDVASMELPPGWRGYGARNAIEHPATAGRAAEIDAIRCRLRARRPLHRAAGPDALRSPDSVALPRAQCTTWRDVMNAPTDPAMRVLTVRLPDGAGGVCEHEVARDPGHERAEPSSSSCGARCPPPCRERVPVPFAGACNTCGIRGGRAARGGLLRVHPQPRAGHRHRAGRACPGLGRPARRHPQGARMMTKT
jgi:hypothetical protein